jgi:hypothetical protein
VPRDGDEPTPSEAFEMVVDAVFQALLVSLESLLMVRNAGQTVLLRGFEVVHFCASLYLLLLRSNLRPMAPYIRRSASRPSVWAALSTSYSATMSPRRHSCGDEFLRRIGNLFPVPFIPTLKLADDHRLSSAISCGYSQHH